MDSSQGQYRAIMEQEVPLIHEAFRRIDVNYRPKLTIVICVRLLALSLHLLFQETSGQTASHSFLPYPTK